MEEVATLSIGPIPPIAPLPPLTGGGATGATGAAAGGFAQALGHAVQGLNSLQNSASAAEAALAGGNVQDVSGAMVTAEEASLQLQLAVQLQNKAIAAYQQMMQLQL